MNCKEYLEIFTRRIEPYYDIKETKTPLPFSLQAELHASDEGYFLVRNLKTYSVQHHEYIYVVTITQTLTMEIVKPYLDYIKNIMINLKTTTEHMNSLFSLVLLCTEGCDPLIQTSLCKLKYSKNYCFSLKGWSDLAIYLINFPLQKIYCNKIGKKNLKLYSFLN